MHVVNNNNKLLTIVNCVAVFFFKSEISSLPPPLNPHPQLPPKKSTEKVLNAYIVLLIYRVLNIFYFERKF